MEGKNWQAHVPVSGVSGGATWNLRCLLQRTFRTLSAGAPAERAGAPHGWVWFAATLHRANCPASLTWRASLALAAGKELRTTSVFSDSPAYKIAGHINSVQEVRVGKSHVVEVPALLYTTMNLSATIAICHVFYCTLIYYKACYEGMNCICHC